MGFHHRSSAPPRAEGITRFTEQLDFGLEADLGSFAAVDLGDVGAFIRKLRRRHPELQRRVVWTDFINIAHREQIVVRVTKLSRPARLLRYGQHLSIRINESLDRTARTRYGMHELAHFFRDDPGEACYHADDEWLPSPSEDFAELFAWISTYPGHIPGLR